MSNYPFNNPWLPQYNQGMPAAPQQVNPYLQNYIQQGQYAQQPQQPQIKPVQGRMISSVEEITANEVPSDGSVGYFPVSDGSAIYAKTWTGDGRLITAKYVVEEQPPTDENSTPQITLADVVNQISNLQNTVDALAALIQPEPKSEPVKTTSRVKKVANNA